MTIRYTGVAGAEVQKFRGILLVMDPMVLTSQNRLKCVADFVVSFFSSNSRCMTLRWIGVTLGLDHFTGMSMVLSNWVITPI